MKLSVKCDSFNMAKKLIEKEVDIIYLGIEDFSCRFNDYVNIEEIKEIVKIKNKTKISILLNNLYSENEISNLEDLLINLSKINIDEICFHDYTILEIMYEKKIKIKTHYNPETLNTNYGQIAFFKKNKINKISLARELSIIELENILKNKEDIEVEIQGHGLTFFMHSKWPMVSNFKKYLLLKKQKLNNLKYLIIQEEKRKMPNIIFEDKTGTHMFSGFILCTYELLEKLFKLNLDSILIDNIFKTEEWTLIVVDIYKEKINEIKNKKNGINNFEKLKNLESEFPLSESFLGDFKKMPQMEREDYEN